MKRPEQKTHIVRWETTACGRKARGLVASVVLRSAPFVMLKAHLRDEIISRTTCKQCLMGRYNA